MAKAYRSQADVLNAKKKSGNFGFNQT